MVISVAEAGVQLSQLINRAIDGEEIVIVDDEGRAVRVVPVRESGHPRFGSGRGSFVLADDFDAPIEEMKQYGG